MQMKRPTKKKLTKPEPMPDPYGYMVGYARVSTDDQRLDLQTDALSRAGVRPDNMHVDKLSAASKRRPGLENAIRDLREGDTLVVWKLDRLARSMRELHRRLDEIYGKGAKLKSLTENFDFDTATGRLIMHVMAAVAEFERQLIAQRTGAGMKAAAEQGAKFGAKKKLDDKKLERAEQMLLKDGATVASVARKLGVDKSLLFKRFPGGRSALLIKHAKLKMK